jgi:hypothetical protein
MSSNNIKYNTTLKAKSSVAHVLFSMALPTHVVKLCIHPNVIDLAVVSVCSWTWQR